MYNNVVYYDRRPAHIEKIFVDCAKPEIDLTFYEPEQEKQGDITKAEAILCHARGVTKDIIDSAPNLKIIQTAGIGFDSQQLEYAREKGVYICNCKGGASDCVAELDIGLMIALCRRIVQCAGETRNGAWPNWKYRHDTPMVTRKTLGVIGAGGIGRSVLKRCKAFDMKELYYDVVRMPEALEMELGAQYVDLDTLLKESDVVMLLVPLMPSTYKMIGAREFKLMKSSAVIINDSRGECIDQDALVEALKNKEIWGAALDVVYPEPLPADHPLFQIKDANLIVTPHLGSSATELMVELFKFSCDNVVKCLSGERPENIVNGL